MTQDSITLIGRYVDSYKEYFEVLRNDRILSMVVNPLLATHGCDDMKALMGRAKGDEFITNAKHLLTKNIKKFTQGMEAETASTTEESAPSEDDDIGDDFLSPEERLEKSRLSARVKRKIIHTSGLADRIHAAVEAFFDQNFDPEVVLKEQYMRMRKDCSSVDWARVKKNETLYISSLFDCLEWWMHCRKEHKLVFLVVPPVLACPSANGLQECIFSACTWFDNPLRQSLSDKRFEMAVLLAVNEALLKCNVPTEEEAKEIVARAVAKYDSSLVLDFGAESE